MNVLGTQKLEIQKVKQDRITELTGRLTILIQELLNLKNLHIEKKFPFLRYHCEMISWGYINHSIFWLN